MGIHPLRIFGRTTSAPLPRPALVLGLVAGLAVGMTGCPGDQPLPAPAATSSKATAPALPQNAPQQAPGKPASASTLTPDQRRSQQVIAQTERAFQSGEAHYRKGQLVQAKQDFDSAVDIMLASGLDIKADPLLDDEFNRILDAVNALEMEALKRGNGFAPVVEPTPADVANDVTFEVDPNLVAKAKEELTTTKSDIPLVINDYVAAYINFFANTQKGHNTLKHSLQRSGRYKAMIQRVMAEEGVPQDLIYLAVAESAFQPQAVNHGSGAGGMWQFMPHGDYGLVRNGYVDERFDPEKSTRAYARYMKFIYNQLGDWYLAMAGYDWGSGNVQRAVQKTGYADYWELYKRNNLPGETKNYVPEILAAIIISKNPTQYGFDDVQLDPPILTDTVPIDYAVDLRLVADIVDAQPQELLALNPSLLRLTTPPPGTLAAPFDLHLPAGTATLFRQHIAEIPEGRRTQWRYHRVTPEDTLASVARSFHVSAEQLATANQLHADDALDSVEALVVPVPLPSSPASRIDVYKARRGDTLVTIADRFGVSLEDLHRWNHSTGTSVSAGQRVRVTEPARVAPHTRDRGRKGTAVNRKSGAGSQENPATTRPNATAHTSKKTDASKGAGKQKKHSARPDKPASVSSTAHKQSDSKKVSTNHKSTTQKNIQK
jgi:membrane-bound lytic murein transglycosylase D